MYFLNSYLILQDILLKCPDVLE